MKVHVLIDSYVATYNLACYCSKLWLAFANPHIILFHTQWLISITFASIPHSAIY